MGDIMSLLHTLISNDHRTYNLRNIAKWKLQFNIWPRRCRLSNKLLWLTYSYKGVRMITGPGESIFYNYYIEKSEFILWNLRGKK